MPSSSRCQSQPSITDKRCVHWSPSASMTWVTSGPGSSASTQIRAAGTGPGDAPVPAASDPGRSAGDRTTSPVDASLGRPAGESKSAATGAGVTAPTPHTPAATSAGAPPLGDAPASPSSAAPTEEEEASHRLGVESRSTSNSPALTPSTNANHSPASNVKTSSLRHARPNNTEPSRWTSTATSGTPADTAPRSDRHSACPHACNWPPADAGRFESWTSTTWPTRIASTVTTAA
jgi:hypothetical protein